MMGESNMKRVLGPVVVAAILIPLAAQTGFASGGKKLTASPADVTIRGQATDILQGDQGANSRYLNGEGKLDIADRDRGLNSLGYADQATFMFDERDVNNRYVQIKSAHISASPIRCASATIYVFSRSVPHWFNQVGPGSSTMGDGSIRCFVGQPGPTGRGWYITYSDFGAECVSIENLGTNENGRPEWRFSADNASPQCVAHVWSFENSNRSYRQTHVGHGYAGPFQITAELYVP